MITYLGKELTLAEILELKCVPEWKPTLQLLNRQTHADLSVQIRASRLLSTTIGTLCTPEFHTHPFLTVK